MEYMSPMGYQPVYNPALPFRNPIYGGLRAGMSVYIQGEIPHHVHRFCVNFLCGQMDGADIAFHFNPRFDGKDRVVFNTFQSGSWGGEEKKKDGFPFHKGKHFELVFFINPACFQVNVNGSPFYEFQHRIPLERVESVQVEGDVTIQSLSIVGGGGGGGPMTTPSFPSGGMMPMPGYPSMNLPAMGGPTYNPVSIRRSWENYIRSVKHLSLSSSLVTLVLRYPQRVMFYGLAIGRSSVAMIAARMPVPYYANIPGGVMPKRTFVIKGFIPMGSQMFHINFKTSNGDIALHFNVRLNECTVVRNSLFGGAWGREEREMIDNPFMQGQYFDISIRTGNGRYKIFVNGQHFCDYAHRFRELQRIDTLEIEGDVVLSLVQF